MGVKTDRDSWKKEGGGGWRKLEDKIKNEKVNSAGEL